MTRRTSHLLPLLFITLSCVGGVEAVYFGVERFLLDPGAGERVERKVLPAPEAESQAAGTKKPVANPSLILDRDLFGLKREHAGERSPAPVTKPLEATTLDIVLMGTTHGPDGMTRAIILNKSDRRQKLYERGDMVQDAVIKEIERGFVVLTLDGRDEMLDMSEAGKYASPMNVPSASQRQLTKPRGGVARPGRASLPDGGPRVAVAKQVRPQPDNGTEDTGESNLEEAGSKGKNAPR